MEFVHSNRLEMKKVVEENKKMKERKKERRQIRNRCETRQLVVAGSY
jgi:hypothetical protein